MLVVILGDYCFGHDKRNACGQRPGNTGPVKRSVPAKSARPRSLSNTIHQGIMAETSTCRPGIPVRCVLSAKADQDYLLTTKADVCRF